MSNIVTASHPVSKNILTFREDVHVYSTDKIKKFTSGTTFIHHFFKPFDEESISRNYAIKHNRTQKDVLAEWHKKRDDSCELGTNVHLYCENLFLGKELPKPINDKAKAYMKVADTAVSGLLKKYDLVETEMIFFSEDLEADLPDSEMLDKKGILALAGMGDIVMRNKHTGILYLLDWKTNKEIKRTNPFGNFGLDPIKHIPDNNFNHYSLQLNLYKYLMLKEKYFDEEIKMAIIHLNTIKPKWIPIENNQNDIKKMIKHFIKNKEKK